MNSTYWRIFIEEAFAEIGITATSQQTKAMVEWVEGAHEQYGMAHGHDCIPNPLKLDNERLTKELVRERDKVQCPACKGRGSITHSWMNRSSTESCWKCHGEGRIDRKNL